MREATPEEQKANQKLELKSSIEILLHDIKGKSIEELRELGYNWNEADCLRSLVLTFGSEKIVSGTVHKS